MSLGIACTPTVIGNANFQKTYAGNPRTGKCETPYYGSPTLYCNLTGYWNQTITGNPCSCNFFFSFLLFFFFLLFP